MTCYLQKYREYISKIIDEVHKIVQYVASKFKYDVRL